MNDASANAKPGESKFDFPFNQDLARRLATNIDPCGFSTILSYFLSPTSEIEQVMIVESEYALEEVAAFCIEPPPGKATVMLEEMCRRKVIHYGVPDLSHVHPSDRYCAVEFSSIPADRMVQALYVPPTYIIQLTNEFWR